jgi:non-specific serine/threonine protein kinase/serine/threonine-protein kinase
VAQQRKTDPLMLARLCRGDLDWITMKALDKDRTRRYASASELAADLQRHLANEPVSAGPPSVGYRARKFVRRHRLGVAFAASLIGALLVGLGGTAYGLLRALRAEAATRLEAETVRQVSDFMLGLFEIVDPGEARGRTITAKEVLDRGAARIRGELAEEPELQARLMETMGTTYRSLGLYGDAMPLLEGALDVQSRAHGPAHPAVASVRTTLAGLLIKQGRSDEAIPLLEEALGVQEAALPPDDPELARTLNNLGNAYRLRGRDGEALSCLERALGIRERALGAEHPDVAKQLSNLGAVRLRMGDPDGARRDFERALGIRERAFGPEHVDVAATLDNLATLYKTSGDLDRARATAERALAIEERHLGPDHPDLVNTLVNLGLIARESGDLAAAESLLRRALALARPRLEPDQRDRRLAHAELAATLRAAGKDDEAAALERSGP